jgi:C4-dicarboxylate-specific signal transduction histidine kinase
VIEILGADLRANRVEVRTDLAAERLTVLGHRGQLQEVVINLVTNAMEAMAANPDDTRVLRVKTEQDPRDNVSMTIDDSGPGVPVDQQGHLFDAFITSKSQGMGLGLAICKMIVERHGGHISAVSNAHATGASFRFVLPRDLPTNFAPLST